jgi:hypothetical protein
MMPGGRPAAAGPACSSEPVCLIRIGQAKDRHIQMLLREHTDVLVSWLVCVHIQLHVGAHIGAVSSAGDLTRSSVSYAAILLLEHDMKLLLLACSCQIRVFAHT